ncbi:uncharacterized protein LOC114580927 [Dendrobium catenatum]|uniref:uncharacterized protein LOC114580927 n=1 Tax=Dendrobium catenatum TaxID=906689 RepID=UPI00109F6670|nr:uncharacterized protein LOC114580927 [Dendrobium catenatum]
MVSRATMGDQESISPLPPSYTAISASTSTAFNIPANLKFLVSNIKNLIPYSLTSENYPIWRTQILQQFLANDYAGHLTGQNSPPVDASTVEYKIWQTADSNLLSALFSTISQYILPYIITSTTTHEAWTVLERRLQPTSRSRVIQLKNELYHVQLKDLSIQLYLSHIKSIVDNISASGSKIDPEDTIIHFLLSFQEFYAFSTQSWASPSGRPSVPSHSSLYLKHYAVVPAFGVLPPPAIRPQHLPPNVIRLLF